MDLSDMSSRPDDECKWILQLRDHCSKFSWAHALTSKRASEVAAKLVQTLCLFGSPRLLQSDNGKEFVAAVIEELTKAWPGLTIIQGRPRHPQSQVRMGRNFRYRSIESILLKYCDEILQPPLHLSAYIMEGRLNILETYLKSEEIIRFYPQFSCICRLYTCDYIEQNGHVLVTTIYNLHLTCQPI